MERAAIDADTQDLASGKVVRQPRVGSVETSRTLTASPTSRPCSLRTTRPSAGGRDRRTKVPLSLAPVTAFALVHQRRRLRRDAITRSSSRSRPTPSVRLDRERPTTVDDPCAVRSASASTRPVGFRHAALGSNIRRVSCAVHLQMTRSCASVSITRWSAHRTQPSPHVVVRS
jgi:hypothetical protein